MLNKAFLTVNVTLTLSDKCTNISLWNVQLFYVKIALVLIKFTNEQ